MDPIDQSADPPEGRDRPAAALRWLYAELPGLVESGVLGSDTAERLREHYGPVAPATTSRDRAMLVFGVLGAVLVGLGIILLFAFNWHTLSRAAKTVVSFLPLLLGMATLSFAVLKRPASAAWREASGSFLFLALGASLGLLHQVYQIGGDLGPFLFVWLLLAAPILYLAEATLPALLFLGGVLLWSSTLWDYPVAERLRFWLMAAIPLPYLWWRARGRLDGVHAVLLRWGYVLLLLPGLFLTYRDLLEDHWPLVLGAYLGTIYLLEAIWRDGSAKSEMPSPWRRPFHIAGAIGLVVFGLVSTFTEPWEIVQAGGWDSFLGIRGSELAALASLDRALLAPLLLAYLALLARAWQVGRLADLSLGTLALSAVLGYGVAAGGGSTVLVAWLFSLHLFVVSVWGIARGMQQDAFGQVSGSLGILSLLVLLRFFDSELGLLARGLVFIAVGLGFLAANLVLARRMRS